MHVLICMLAWYLTWRVRKAWAPLIFTDEDPPRPGQPSRPGPSLPSRPGQGLSPARYGRPYRSFRGLLGHLATLTRNQVRFVGTQATVPMLARTHQRLARGLQSHRRPDPAQLEVARTRTGQPGKTPG